VEILSFVLSSPDFTHLITGSAFLQGDGTLIPDTATALAYYDHPWLQQYPAITRNHCGKGTLTYEGTVLSDNVQEKVLLAVLQMAGLTGPDQDLPSAVHVKHGTNRAGRIIHYYLNYFSDPQKVQYSYGAGADLLTGGSVSQSQAILLKPWDLDIVEEK
jgi:beta-galactosidase